MSKVSWAYQELEKKLSNEEYQDRIVLTDPKVIDKLDDTLLTKFWKPIQNLFEANNLSIQKGCLSDQGTPIIGTVGHKKLTRKFTLVIDNPANPWTRDNYNRIWYCRMGVFCDRFGYRYDIDFSIQFSLETQFKDLIELISNPYLKGNPPELSYFEGVNIPDYYNISFHMGSGAGWLYELFEPSEAEFKNKIKNLSSLIFTVESFSPETGNGINFYELQENLINVFEAW